MGFPQNGLKEKAGGPSSMGLGGADSQMDFQRAQQAQHVDPKNNKNHNESVQRQPLKPYLDYVGVAFEALQAAKKNVVEKGLNFEEDRSSVRGSNFFRSYNNRRRYFTDVDDHSLILTSPESQTIDC
ncbi:hypothetical protein AgCh_003563 [Apium graveolens]